MIDYRELLKKFLKALIKGTGSSQVPNALPHLNINDSEEITKLLMEVHS